MLRFIILAGIRLLATVSLVSANGDGSPKAAAYRSAQQHADVKVTLLKVARITSFGPADVNGLASVVPGVEVTYAVEDIGATPLGQFQVGGVKCLVANEPAGMMAGIVAGGQGVTEAWAAIDPEDGLKRPEVASSDRARIRRDYLRGVVVDRDRIDLHSATGFGGLQTFKFKDIPLAGGG